jgi:hypothetical protein
MSSVDGYSIEVIDNEILLTRKSYRIVARNSISQMLDFIHNDTSTSVEVQINPEEPMKINPSLWRQHCETLVETENLKLNIGSNFSHNFGKCKNFNTIEHFAISSPERKNVLIVANGIDENYEPFNFEDNVMLENVRTDYHMMLEIFKRLFSEKRKFAQNIIGGEHSVRILLDQNYAESLDTVFEISFCLGKNGGLEKLNHKRFEFPTNPVINIEPNSEGITLELKNGETINHEIRTNFRNKSEIITYVDRILPNEFREYVLDDDCKINENSIELEPLHYHNIIEFYCYLKFTVAKRRHSTYSKLEAHFEEQRNFVRAIGIDHNLISLEFENGQNYQLQIQTDFQTENDIRNYKSVELYDITLHFKLSPDCTLPENPFVKINLPTDEDGRRRNEWRWQLSRQDDNLNFLYEHSGFVVIKIHEVLFCINDDSEFEMRFRVDVKNRFSMVVWKRVKTDEFYFREMNRSTRLRLRSYFQAYQPDLGQNQSPEEYFKSLTPEEFHYVEIDLQKQLLREISPLAFKKQKIRSLYMCPFTLSLYESQGDPSIGELKDWMWKLDEKKCERTNIEVLRFISRQDDEFKAVLKKWRVHDKFFLEEEAYRKTFEDEAFESVFLGRSYGTKRLCDERDESEEDLGGIEFDDDF